MKDIFADKYDHYEILIFISGIFSTFQAVAFHGITAFSWFLLALLFVGVVEKRGRWRISFSGVKEILIGLVILTTTITELITLFLNEYPAWTSRSVNNYILMTAVLLLFFVMREDKNYVKLYLKGVIWSCIIQYIACYVEYAAYTFLNYDLTERLFDIPTKVRDERLIIGGLTTNPGMLVPVVLIGLCLSKNIAVRLMAVIAALLINSTTCMICVGMFFLFNIILFLKDKASRGWDLRKIVFAILAILIMVFLISAPLRTRIRDLYSYAGMRISNAAADEADTDKSTAYHYRYYTSLPYIFDHIPTVRKVFGYGKNCSGIPFSKWLRQYTDKIWIPETDPIATLYDVGIVGFLAMYALIFKLAGEFWNESRLYGIFITCVLIGGIFYGFQMTWLLLLELLLCDRSALPLSKAEIITAP